MSLAIITTKTTDDMFSAAVSGFLKDLEITLGRKQFFDVALSGGATAQGFFVHLLTALKNHKDLRKIRFFFSDERAVSMESNDSNAGNAWRLVIAPLNIAHDQFFPMYDGIHSPSVCAQHYQQLLQTKLEKNHQGIPIFDVLFLGIGQDGHTASLFPHSALLARDDHSLVCATVEKNIAYERITLMPKIIKSATHICVMASGQSKVAIINDIITGPLAFKRLPAQMVLRDPKTAVTLLVADMGEINPT